MTSQPALPATTKSDIYPLARDYRATSRLNYQHYLWHETLQYNLHPTLLSSLPPRPRIADVACGTAIWLRSVASQLPQAQLDGYDLSLAQCPPTQRLPDNIALREWDLFAEPLAEEMLGAYDVVHIRLIFTIVANDDPGVVIRNLVKLLKPGGWLQWDELDVGASYLLRITPAIEAPTMDEVVVKLRRIGNWVGQLSERMEECRLICEEIERVEEKKELASAFFDCNLGKDEEVATGLLKAEEEERKTEGEKLLDMVTKMRSESARGVIIVSPKVVAIGQKHDEVA